MREFCTDSGTYVDSRNEQFLPQRLQYFLPCISSPLYSFLSDHYYISAILDTSEFSVELDKWKENHNDVIVYTPTFNNVSSENYSNIVASSNDDKFKKIYNHAVNVSKLALIVDESRTCRWTKEKLRNEQFLMCSFTMDAVERLYLTQAIAGLIMIIIIFCAIGEIKKLKFAETLHMSSSQQDKQGGYIGRPARSKRTDN